jgi:hypothetical protein
MSPKPQIVREPKIIMYEDPNGTLITQIHPAAQDSPATYGLYVCDIVRHAARMYQVHEASIWEWVEREKRKATTTITGGIKTNGDTKH